MASLLPAVPSRQEHAGEVGIVLGCLPLAALPAASEGECVQVIRLMSSKITYTVGEAGTSTFSLMYGFHDNDHLILSGFWFRWDCHMDLSLLISIGPCHHQAWLIETLWYILALSGLICLAPRRRLDLLFPGWPSNVLLSQSPPLLQAICLPFC